MPNINEMCVKLEGFNHALLLHLRMAYYHIWLSEGACSLFTIILPLGKYHYKNLLMGVINTPGILQQKMNYLLQYFEFIRVYIDNLLIMNRVYWTNQVRMGTNFKYTKKKVGSNVIFKVFIRTNWNEIF